MNLPRRNWVKSLVIVSAAVISWGVGTVGVRAADPVKFQVWATADTGAWGYNQGSTNLFTWIVDSGFASNGTCYFLTAENGWFEEYIDDTPLFSSISGQGLGGGYVRPTGDNTDPYNDIIVDASGLELFTGNDGAYSIGFNADTTQLRYLWADTMRWSGQSFSYPGSYTDPNGYFASLAGTYDLTSGQVGMQSIDNSLIYFSAFKLTISTIPEPSTALLTGLGLLALAFRKKLSA